MHNQEGFWLFDIDSKGLRAKKGSWYEGGYRLSEQSVDDNRSDNKGSSV